MNASNLRKPTVEVVGRVTEQQPIPVRLAYARATGWTIVAPSNHKDVFVVRGTGRQIPLCKILAWAELPPVPKGAA
jgi:hypothetical protein